MGRIIKEGIEMCLYVLCGAYFGVIDFHSSSYDLFDMSCSLVCVVM